MNFSETKCAPQPPEGWKLKYRKWANSEAIFAVLVSQNCVNGPQIKYNRPGYNHTVHGGPFVAILGHFGPFLVHFGVNLAARARGWGQFGANFSPIKLFKTSWMTTNQVQWVRIWTHGTSGVLLQPFWAILGHLGVILVTRTRGWGQFGANFSPFRLFKTAWMTTNQVQWARLLTHGTSRGPLRASFCHF